MQFNSHVSSLDLISDISFWTKASTTRYPLVDRTRNANFALDRMCALALESDGRWKWDDTNHTDQPVGTTSLVANQQDYEISGASFLKIDKVQILQSDGKYQIIDPVDEHSPDAINLMEKRQTGTPLRYLKRGNSIYLDPILGSALSAGLRIFFQRNVSYFVDTDTTKEPGFAQPFHRLVSLYASEDYLAANGIVGRLATVQRKIQFMEAAFIMFYSHRDEDQKVRIDLKKENYGANRLKRNKVGGGTSNSIVW